MAIKKRTKLTIKDGSHDMLEVKTESSDLYATIKTIEYDDSYSEVNITKAEAQQLIDYLTEWVGK